MNISNKGLRITAAVFMLLASITAWPQAHTSQSGAYVLRSSTVGTENLPEETARAHGIERDPHRAVLNVTVTKEETGAGKTVPAQVQAYARNLAGMRRDVDMRETAVNGFVSYTGTYEFAHGEVLDFHITAKPKGSSKTLSMTYRDRLWAGGDLPDVPPRHQ